MSKWKIPAALRLIHAATMTVWPTRNVGVPKNRANASALSANQSLPKTGARWRCGTWKRKWCCFAVDGAGGVKELGSISMALTKRDAGGGVQWCLMSGADERSGRIPV